MFYYFLYITYQNTNENNDLQGTMSHNVFIWLARVITGCFQGVRAGATPRTVVYIHV